MKNKFLLVVVFPVTFSLFAPPPVINFLDDSAYTRQLEILQNELDTKSTSENHKLIAYKILTILEIQKILKENKFIDQEVDMTLKNKALLPFSSLFSKKGPDFSFLKDVLDSSLLKLLSADNNLFNEYLNYCIEYSEFIFKNNNINKSSNAESINIQYLGYINNLHLLMQKVYELYQKFPQLILQTISDTNSISTHNLLYQLKNLLDREIKNYETSENKVSQLKFNVLRTQTYEQLIQKIQKPLPPLDTSIESLLYDMLLWVSFS